MAAVVIRAEADGAFLRVLRRRGALAVTSYQTGVLIVLAAAGRGMTVGITELHAPMGIARRHGELVIAGRSGLDRWTQTPGGWRWIGTLPTDPSLDVHDAARGPAHGWWVAATGLDMVAHTAGGASSWWPPGHAPGQDHLHLNGLAAIGDALAYVTCFATTGRWRDGPADAGAVLRVPEGEPVYDHLVRPHSPRVDSEGRLWFAEAGTGHLWRAGAPVAQVDGFARGLAFDDAGNVLAGSSCARSGGVFEGLPISGGGVCGVFAFRARDGAPAGQLVFTEGVREIYDLAFIGRPGVPEPANLAGRLPSAVQHRHDDGHQHGQERDRDTPDRHPKVGAELSG